MAGKLTIIKTIAIGVLGFGAVSSLVIAKNSSKVASASAGTYYNSITNTTDASTLLSSLQTLLGNGKKHSGTKTNLWTVYTSTYTNSSGYVKDYYNGSTTFTSSNQDTGSGNAEGQYYNREHSIPKSWWGASDYTTGDQSTDPFIVIPSDKYVNSKRSNYSYGIVSSSPTYTSDGGCKLGTGTIGSTSATVFEPPSNVKGDLARIVFYARVRWPNSYSWTSGSGNLVFSGSASTNYGLTSDAIAMFTKWSNDDPVDDWEMSVNDSLHSNSIYGNRNPFVDHPEWVNVIWGGTTYSGSGSSSSSESSGGSSSSESESSGSGSSVSGATYTVTSTTAVSSSGVPSGSSATFSQTYSTAGQMTKGNTMTLTLSGYGGYRITGMTLSMKSNAKAGAGYISLVAGSTTLYSLGSSSSGVAFNNSSFYGSYSSSYVNLTPDITSTTIGDGETVTLVIGATTNSLYCQSMTFSYESTSSSTVAVTSVSVSPTSLSLTAGNTSQLTASVLPSNATTKTVTWSSSNTSVATVSSSGLVTAVAAGSATITVTTDDGSYTAACTVTVTSSTTYVTAVSLDKSTMSLTVGGSTGSLTATLTGNTYSTISWSSSTEDYATVAGSETSATVSPVAEGTATITVTVTANSKTYSASCIVTVAEEESLTTGSFEITFTTNSNDGTTALTSSTIASEVQTGSEYISNFDTPSNTFAGKSGLKLGSSSKSGSFTFNTSSTFQSHKIKSITVSSAKYSSDTGTLTLSANGSSVKSSIDPSEGGTYTFSSATTVTSVGVATSSKRAYVSGLTFTYEDDDTSSSSSSSGSGSLTIDINNYNSAVGVTSTGLETNTTHNELIFDKNGSDSVLISGYYTGITKVTLSVYMSNTEYDPSISVYNGSSSSGTSVTGTSSISGTTVTVVYTLDSADEVYILNASGYTRYLYSITVEYSSTTVWDWVNEYLHMTDYTENLGYCADTTHAYYDNAKTALLNLTSGAISEFQSDSQYADALARYQAWATANNDSTPFASSSANRGPLTESNTTYKVSILIFVSCMTGIIAIAIISIRKKYQLTK